MKYNCYKIVQKFIKHTDTITVGTGIGKKSKEPLSSTTMYHTFFMAHLIYIKAFIRNGLVVINIEVKYQYYAHILEYTGRGGWVLFFSKISFYNYVYYNPLENMGGSKSRVELKCIWVVF